MFFGSNPKRVSKLKCYIIMAVQDEWWRKGNKFCTPDELVNIISTTWSGFYSIPSAPYNEVFPNIFLSNGSTAKSLGLLKQLGITHVVNAAYGNDSSLYLIDTSAEYYRESNIKFLGIEALDLTSFHIEPYFEAAADFIQEALDSGGKVLVHCRQGISRSASIVLAYLMIKCNKTLQEAFKMVRQQREINPNYGFLKQLCNLNDQLQMKSKQKT